MVYATKSAEDFGLGERRITPEVLPLLNLPDHVDHLIRVGWQLGEHSAYEGLRRWVHMLGFRGHFASKSRCYSTTLGAIRGERRAYRQRQAAEQTHELADDEQDSTLIVAHWNSSESATSPVETPPWHSPPPPEHGNDSKRHVRRHREDKRRKTRREHR